MINYDPFWTTLKHRNLSQYQLVHTHHFSAGQLNRIRNSKHVSTHTLEKLCIILQCEVQDLVYITGSL